MGGCATKPATLEFEEAPTPVEAPEPLDAPTPIATEKAETTVPQENENVGETNKEEPLVDLTEPTTNASKTEEQRIIAAEAKPETEEVIVVEIQPKEPEVEAKEEKKEVQETEAPKETEVVAPKSEEVKSH